jgi:tricarballylate dehydrogenase
MGYEYDIIIVGAGVSGSSAALSALDYAESVGAKIKVLMLERADPNTRGGSSRHTTAYLRFNDDCTAPSDQLVNDAVKYLGSDVRIDLWERIQREGAEVIKWLKDHGVDIEPLKITMFLTAKRPRCAPVGGGVAIIDALLSRAISKGLQISYRSTAWKIALDEDGNIEGVYVRQEDGTSVKVTSKAVILATGGFQGSRALLREYIGGNAEYLKSILARHEVYHKGEGLKMALEIGADLDGEFGNFHAEPVDARNDEVEPVILIYPYGILVNIYGERFVDEGIGTVEEYYDYIAKEIFKQPMNRAFLIADKKIFDIPNYQNAVLSGLPPIEANTIEELARKLVDYGLKDPNKLIKTIEEYNHAKRSNMMYDPLRLDKLYVQDIVPPKSNWAVPIDTPPFIAYPMEARITYAYIGLKTDTNARVLDTSGNWIKGLWAVGELMGGLYRRGHLGGTSVFRGIFYGYIAGRDAVNYVLRG